MNTIISIDPGTTHSAWMRYICGVPNGWEAEHDNDCLLWTIRSDYFGIDRGLLVIERIESYGMAVGRETFDTVEWAGRFREAWESRGGTVLMLPRRAVKLHLCGTMKAKDANIRQRLVEIYGGKDKAIGCKKSPGPLYGIKSHAWSALALAVTAEDTQGDYKNRNDAK